MTSQRFQKLQTAKRLEFKEIFKSLDGDNKGHLSVLDLQRAVFKTLGIKPSRRAVELNFRCIDLESGGSMLGRHAFLAYLSEGRLLDEESAESVLDRNDGGKLMEETGCGMFSFLRIYWRKLMLDRLVQGGNDRDILIRLAAPNDALFHARMLPIRSRQRTVHFDDIAFTKKVRAREEQRQQRLLKTRSDATTLHTPVVLDNSPAYFQPALSSQSTDTIQPLNKSQSAPAKEIGRLTNESRMNSLTLFLEEGDNVDRVIERVYHTTNKHHSQTPHSALRRVLRSPYITKKVKLNSSWKSSCNSSFPTKMVQNTSQREANLKEKLAPNLTSTFRKDEMSTRRSLGSLFF